MWSPSEFIMRDIIFLIEVHRKALQALIGQGRAESYERSPRESAKQCAKHVRCLADSNPVSPQQILLNKCSQALQCI